MKNTIAGIVVVALVIVGGVYVSRHGGSNANTIFAQSIAAASKVNSEGFSGELKADGSDNGSKFSFDATLEGAAEKLTSTAGTSTSADSIEGRGWADFKINASADSMPTPVSLDGSIVFDNEVVYVKANLPPTLAASVPFVASLSGKWIKIDPAELKSSGLVPNTAITTTNKLTAEQQKQIQDLAVKSNIFIFSSSAKETVDGESTYHLKGKLNPEGFTTLITGVSKIMNQPAPDQTALAQMQKSLKVVADNSTVELWISESTSLLSKMNFTADLGAIAKSQDSSAQTTGTISATLMLKDFGKPVTVTIPATSKSIKDVLAPFFLGMTGVPATR